MKEEFFRDRSMGVPGLLFAARGRAYSRRDADEK